MTTDIRKICEICRGDGVIPSTDINGDPAGNIDCSNCVPTGDNLWGTLELPTNVFDSYIILEELDATEHAALTDTQKDGVLHILACGKVDLNDGKAGKVRLWNWFGAESTTVANLTALLT